MSNKLSKADIKPWKTSFQFCGNTRLPDYGTLDSLHLFCLLSVIRKEWLDQRRPINAYGWIPDRFYVISMKFLLLSRSC